VKLSSYTRAAVLENLAADLDGHEVYSLRPTYLSGRFYLIGHNGCQNEYLRVKQNKT
jgi:hypothetical protein